MHSLMNQHRDSVAVGHAAFYVSGGAVRGDIIAAHELYTSPSHFHSASAVSWLSLLFA